MSPERYPYNVQSMIGDLPYLNRYERSGYVCPYCGDEMPSAYEPSQWSCCGEAGRAVTVEEYEKHLGESVRGITTAEYEEQLGGSQNWPDPWGLKDIPPDPETGGL